MKKIKECIIIVGMVLLMMSVNIVFCKTLYASNHDNMKAPDNIRAYRQSNTSIKIKWKTVLDVDGYMIYRYNSLSKKYVKVHTIKHPKDNLWVKWTDKSLETNKIYKYKITSYKTIEGKKYISKLSDWVSAKTYTRNNKKINAKAPKLNRKKVHLGLCSSIEITSKVAPSEYGKNKQKKAFSTTVRWYSSKPNSNSK